MPSVIIYRINNKILSSSLRASGLRNQNVKSTIVSASLNMARGERVRFGGEFIANALGICLMFRKRIIIISPANYLIAEINYGRKRWSPPLPRRYIARDDVYYYLVFIATWNRSKTIYIQQPPHESSRVVLTSARLVVGLLKTD